MTLFQNRYCVITPYYKEERYLLDRCIASVQRQSPDIDHILVADGFPQDWIDALPVRHLKLDRAHGDYGNSARGLGAMMAIAEGYSGITFLDADNWYDDHHIQSCLSTAAQRPDAAYVIAQRKFHRPDGSTMPTIPADAPYSDHVDTNCFFLLPQAYPYLHRWCTIPNRLSAHADRLFNEILRLARIPSVIAPERTVNYQCMFEHIYNVLGEPPPSGCKPIIRWPETRAWIETLPPGERDALERLAGLTVDQMDSIRRYTTFTEPMPDLTRIVAEVPGSSQPVQMRRIPGDIEIYKRLFVESGSAAAAALPAQANLVVDLSAGIGLHAVWLHMRYPDATVVAVEPDPEAFEILSGNLAGRNGCRAIQASVPASGGRGAVGLGASTHINGFEASQDAGLIPTLLQLLNPWDGTPIDLLRLAPEQWQALMATDRASLGAVRRLMIDTPAGPECIDLSESLMPPIDPTAEAQFDPLSPIAA